MSQCRDITALGEGIDSQGRVLIDKDLLGHSKWLECRRVDTRWELLLGRFLVGVGFGQNLLQFVGQKFLAMLGRLCQ